MEDLESIKLIDWLTCKDQLLVYWTEDEINAALIEVGYTEDDLTDKLPFEQAPTYQKPYVKVKSNYRFTKTVPHRRSFNYTKEVTVIGGLYRIRSRFQGLKHGDLIFLLLCSKFPWMKNDIFVKDITRRQYFNVDSFTKLMSVPEEFRSLTINELIALQGTNLYEGKEIQLKRSKFKLYGGYENTNDYMFFCDSDSGKIYIKFSDLFIHKDPDRIIEQSQVKDHEALRETKEFKFIVENLK